MGRIRPVAKVNLNSEIDRFDVSVWVGGTSTCERGVEETEDGIESRDRRRDIESRGV